MAKHVSYRERSRANWGRDESHVTTDDEIKIGCLQRIADATEAMAKNHVQLQSSLDYYKRRAEQLDAQVQHLARSNAALRGVIKRMKKEPSHG